MGREVRLYFPGRFPAFSTGGHAGTQEPTLLHAFDSRGVVICRSGMKETYNYPGLEGNARNPHHLFSHQKFRF